MDIDWQLEQMWKLCPSKDPSTKPAENRTTNDSERRETVYGHQQCKTTKLWRIQILVPNRRSTHWNEMEYFLKKKSDLADKVVSFLKNLHEKDKVIIQSIRCDGAGENKTLKEKCQGTTALAHINFKFTPCDTPQYNGTAKQAFATLYGWVSVGFWIAAYHPEGIGPRVR